MSRATASALISQSRSRKRGVWGLRVGGELRSTPPTLNPQFPPQVGEIVYLRLPYGMSFSSPLMISA
jgi:hypothetical protein